MGVPSVARWFGGLGLALYACVHPTAAFAQPPRVAVDLRMDSIPGSAELSCAFRDPETGGDAIVQGHEVSLLVTVKSPADHPKYALADAVQVLPEPPSSSDRSQHAIRLRQKPWKTRSYQDASYRDVDEWVVPLEIDSGAQPRDHDVQLTFVAANKITVSRTIRLFVGAQNQGQFLDAAAETTSMPTITAGSESTFVLSISNKFPSYRVAVRRIVVSSEPEGLIEHFDEVRMDDIAPGTSKRVEIKLRARDPWWRQLWPIESAPKLNVLLTYDDGYRSEIERLPKIPIDVKLDASTMTIVLVTAVSLVLGALAGTWLRSRFSRLTALEKTLPTWERVLASLVLGGVIAVLAVATKVEILAEPASLHLRLHRPIAILFIALVVAVNNPAEILDRLRKSGQAVSGLLGGKP